MAFQTQSMRSTTQRKHLNTFSVCQSVRNSPWTNILDSPFFASGVGFQSYSVNEGSEDTKIEVEHTAQEKGGLKFQKR